MPVKSFTFAFKIDAKELLAFVADRNIAIDIHATGTNRAALPKPNGQLALPAPDKKSTLQSMVEAYFASHPKETITTKQVGALLGRMPYGTLHILLSKGVIKRVGPAQYRATAKAGALR